MVTRLQIMQKTGRLSGLFRCCSSKKRRKAPFGKNQQLRQHVQLTIIIYNMYSQTQIGAEWGEMHQSQIDGSITKEKARKKRTFWKTSRTTGKVSQELLPP